MSTVQGLRKGKDSYYYSRRVPADLKWHFGTQQISVPLHTSSKRVAEERARAKAAEVDAQFAELRAGIMPRQSLKSKVLPRHDMVQAARHFLYELEINAESLGHRPDLLEQFERDVHGISHIIESGELALSHVSDAAQRYSLVLDQGSDQWFEFGGMLNRAHLESAHRMVDRTKNLHGAVVHDQLFADVWAGLPSPATKKVQGARLGELIERFEADSQRKHLSDSARQKFIIPFKAMVEMLGDDFLVREITRAHCANIRDLIASLPPNHKKIAEFAGLSFGQIAEKNKRAGSAPLSGTSVAAYTQRISTLLSYAVDYGFIESNPAVKLIRKGSSTSTSPHPFNEEELNRMAGKLVSWAEGNNTGRFWVPLIALFCGMRIGEILLLRRNDVSTINGVVSITLTNTPERKLKTKNAARTIPVHNELLALGFETRILDERNSDERLFPDIPGKSQRHAVDLFSKRFGYWSKNELNVRKRVSFHSLRHNFRDAMRNAEFPIDVIRSLGGWSKGSTVEDRYGEGIKVSVLSKWMAKISYPELDLAPLRANRPHPQDL